MATIKRVSMKDQVYEIVKSRILTQKYSFGDTVSILGLSKELEISNTPIREALNMLVAEGLLTSSMNNKFKVIDLTQGLMAELDELVYVLLNGAYESAYRRGMDGDLADKLRNAYMEQEKSIENGDEEYEYIKKTMAFDRCFVEITGNRKLIAIYDQYTNLLYLCVRNTIWSDRKNVEKNLAEHRKLIEAAEKRDKELVLTVLAEHYDKHYEEGIV